MRRLTQKGNLGWGKDAIVRAAAGVRWVGPPALASALLPTDVGRGSRPTLWRCRQLPLSKGAHARLSLDACGGSTVGLRRCVSLLPGAFIGGRISQGDQLSQRLHARLS